jgi:preprotein translocase subunit SecG
MGRNEIRLRRQRLSAGRISRHRNYSVLMEQHEKEMKIKRVIRVFIYFLVILFFVIILAIVLRWEDRNTEKDNNTTSGLVIDKNST